MAIFAGPLGSCSGSECFHRLAAILDSTSSFPDTKSFVSEMCVFVAKESSDPRIAHLFPHPFDIAGWLQRPPDSRLLDAAPVGYVLAGLLQLACFQDYICQCCKRNNSGVFAGHSLGIVAAVAAASYEHSDTDNQFVSASKIALGSLLLAGCLPLSITEYAAPSALYDLEEKSAMASVCGVPQFIVDSVLKKYNALKGYEAIHLASVNVDNLQFACSGESADTVAHFIKRIRQKLTTNGAAAAIDQSSIPFHQRKPDADVVFYPHIYAPLHSPFLENLVEHHMAYAVSKGWIFSASGIRSDVSVRACTKGTNIFSAGMQAMDNLDLTRTIVEFIYTQQVDWPNTIAATSMPPESEADNDDVISSITQIIDFCPSGGPVPLHDQTILNIQGRGVQLYSYYSDDNVSYAATPVYHLEHYPRSSSFSPDTSNGILFSNWRSCFGPKLINNCSLGLSTQVHTRLTNLTGLPPVFIGATAPTTRDVGFVASAARAGYFAELSVEDTVTSEELADRVTHLADCIPTGYGICVNCRQSDSSSTSNLKMPSCRGQKPDDNSSQWQLRTVARLRQSFLPIIGVCADHNSISAADIVILEQAGIRYIAFRATTASDIDCVLRIAQMCQKLTVMIQWTGGRCGGVHSLEEFHIPLILAYSSIREHSNVVLVANSGFGNAEGILPYLTGSWGLLFNRPYMPFDGIMVCSRIMTARESRMHDEAKQLIIKAPGIDPYDMLALFGNEPTGGIVSVLNENGHPVHVVANRAALFCHKLSAKVLSHPPDKRVDILRANKDWIMRGLCNNYMRPWFGIVKDRRTSKSEGRNEHQEYVELPEMTYIQVIDRLLELTYIAKERRWIHPTYRNLVAKFVRRTTMRLHDSEQTFPLEAKRKMDYCKNDAVLDEIATVRLAYPDAHTQLLATDDVLFFTGLCRRPGQKSVPFVPTLDADFADYLMKDTEWQSGDLCSVYSEKKDLADAAQRVLISQGPVATRYSRVANEPVKDIMDGIYSELVQQMAMPETGVERQEKERVVDICSNSTESPFVLLNRHTVVCCSRCERTYQLPPTNDNDDGSQGTLPSTDAWHCALAGSSLLAENWLYSILTSPSIVQDKRHVDNYVSRLLRPRHGRTVSVSTASGNTFGEGMPVSVCIWDSLNPTRLELALTLDSASNVIKLVLPHRASTLELRYLFSPGTPVAPIHEIMDGRDERITHFFSEIWKESINGIQETRSVFGLSGSLRPMAYIQRSVTVPKNMSLDMLAIAALPGVFSILTDACVGQGLLDMVQTEYAISKVDNAVYSKIVSEDKLDIVSRVEEIRGVLAGSSKQVIAVSDVFLARDCGSAKCAEIRATFLFKNTRPVNNDNSNDNNSCCFRSVAEPLFTIHNIDSDALKVLESKEWFYFFDMPDVHVKPGNTLEFRLQSEYKLHPRNGMYLHAVTKGSVHLVQGLHDRLHIGAIDYEEGPSLGNPVIKFLSDGSSSGNCQINNSQIEPISMGSADDTLLLARESITVPEDAAHVFADISGDYNPHNTSPYFADLGGLPGPVMQGLWTCSAVRQLVEHRVCKQSSSLRMHSFCAKLTGPVHPGDVLETRVMQAGMHNGRISVSSSTHNAATGVVVLECSAQVAPPRTAYVFTGQGSQEVGMGLDWYRQSSVVRAVYDRADQHTRGQFGFSIIDIIRNNPKEYTVHFSGSDGMRIRQNYSQFPEIAGKDAHTFQALSGGLLHATQFAQPAIMLFDVAMAEEMRARGVFDEDALIAGHSLGEYGALAALGIMSLEDILDITFVRGMTMQATVERDALGQSNFALIAVDPSRVSRGFTEYSLQYVISAICNASEGLLEIVNYNVLGFQYVVAGTRLQLVLLGQVLDFIHDKHISVANGATVPANSSSSGRRAIEQHITNIIQTNALYGSKEPLVPMRTCATIPIPGIDVPFHSSHLLSGAAQFRICINRMVKETSVDPATLVGRYIPNLTAEPFSVSREYFEMMYTMTRSPVIAEELSKWPTETLLLSSANRDNKNRAVDKDKKETSRLARLLLIELLSYQFASPVRWIETQQKLFTKPLAATRLIEIGPNSTLCRMAVATVALMALDDKVEVLHVLSNQHEVFGADSQNISNCQVEKSLSLPVETEAKVLLTYIKDESSSESSGSDDDSHVFDTATAAGAETVGVDMVDIPLTALDVIRTIIAQKLRIPISAVNASQSVRELAGGKSTLQNEILGDLLKEFSSASTTTTTASNGKTRQNTTTDILSLLTEETQHPEDSSLQQLAKAVGAGFSGQQLEGKYTMAQAARLFSWKMPGAFTLSSFRSILATEYQGIGKRRHMQDGVLLTALTMEPESRLGSVVPEAQTWLQTVVKAYAENAGVPFASLGDRYNNSADSDSADEHKRLATEQMEALARYLGTDLREGHRLHEEAEKRVLELQSKITRLYDELGEEFVDGIQPLFDKRMMRRFDSYWNWVCEDTLSLVNEASNIQSGSNEDAIMEMRIKALVNRAACSSEYVEFVSALASYRYNTNICNEDDENSETIAGPSLQNIVAARIRDLCMTTNLSGIGSRQLPVCCELDQQAFSQYVDKVSAVHGPLQGLQPPLVHMRTRQEGSHTWEYSQAQSALYYACLRQFQENSDKTSTKGGGVSFAGRTALITGSSSGSIGAQVVRRLLSGGARVIATTSSFSRQTLQFYETLYKQHGACGAELVVVPFNQASTQDIRHLVEFACNGERGNNSNPQKRGYNQHLDYVLPFAAMADYDADVSGLGARADLSVRMMLTNVLRLLGEVRKHNQWRQEETGTTPTTLAILPLSPNHGVFGGDGMYGETKAALQTVFNRSEAEAWRPHLAVVGAIVGWTRGTRLMRGNDAVAPLVVDGAGAGTGTGACTFSADEMAANITALLHPTMANTALQCGPLWADFNGGLQRIPNIGRAVVAAHRSLQSTSRVARAIAAGYGADAKAAAGGGHRTALLHTDYSVQPLCNRRHMWAPAELAAAAATSVGDSRSKQLPPGTFAPDLDRVVVITGFGEFGPLGHADTRWEMEAFGSLSREGVAELAWITGLVRRAPHADGAWADAATGAPVADAQLRARYEARLRQHTGVRVAPAPGDAVLRTVQLTRDMEPFEASADEAAAFKRRGGDSVDVWARPGDAGQWMVRFRRGAVVHVPRAAATDAETEMETNTEANTALEAHPPDGWTPARHGIPADVAQQVDPVTIYALCAAAEALARAGVADAYELYSHFHVSEVGSALGSGAGGVHAIRDVYCGRMADAHLRSAVLQETFANSTSAWLNMLLLAAAGPIRPPTGGCASALLSVDVAADAIRCGKARVMVAGGFDGSVAQGSVEFALMRATADPAADRAAGREPSEASRPCTLTRAGFIESQGAGVVVLMSAAAALEIGAPVYGVLAHSASATDGYGTSLPAPGKGILTTTAQTPTDADSRLLLDADYRHRQAARTLAAVDALADDSDANGNTRPLPSAAAAAMRAAVRNVWSSPSLGGRLSTVSPLLASLAAWRLTPDDIGMASLHATGTIANDRNEAHVINTQLAHLGRTRGLLLPCVAQKWLTGHPKGAAAAWMLNGALQAMHAGIVPGNRNADNVDASLNGSYLVFPSRSSRTDIRACLLKSFGFGQVSAEALLLHPDFFLACLSQSQQTDYSARLAPRRRKAYRFWQDVYAGLRSFVAVKLRPPFPPDQEERVLLNPLARATLDPSTNEYSF
ncbi:fatty acid synthase alpha subunit Lsd1 [Coemansia sp. RSA 1200]|nr:fatty acid synthase alpha subunit Lsd1 [Coemansia sp. RSA 1200]